MRLLIPLMVLSISGIASARLKFGYDVRYRYEFTDNFNKKFYGKNMAYGVSRDGFLLQRVRAGLDYRREHMAFSLWLQDARAFDWSLPDRLFSSNPNKDYLELYKAFVKLDEPYGLPVEVKVGRQVITYGDHRVFGPGQWGNTGRYLWDAVKLRFVDGKNYIDLFYGRTIMHQIKRFSLFHRHMRSALAAYSHLEWGSGELILVFEPFAFTKWDRHDEFRGERGGSGKLQLLYAGARFSGRWGLVDWDATWLGSWGKRGPDRVDAYAYHWEMGINCRVGKAIVRPYVGVSYASGDKHPDDGRFNRFDGAFGSVDKAYGRMNLFKWSNLVDQEGGVEVSLSGDVYLKVQYHHFRLASSTDGWSLNPSYYRDKSGGSGKEMGHEFDVEASVRPLKNIKLSAGYGHFWPGEFVKKVAGAEEANWFFLQLRITGSLSPSL